MSGPAFDKKRQLPSADVAQPYIDAGLISSLDLTHISEGFARTSRYLLIGAVVGTILPMPLIWRKQMGLIKRMLLGTTTGVVGGLTGGAIGAGRMQSDLAVLECGPVDPSCGWSAISTLT
jgi:uncharacterized membrane protein YeaQ/YmgE (transglycosylase-associated protein family)